MATSASRLLAGLCLAGFCVGAVAGCGKDGGVPGPGLSSADAGSHLDAKTALGDGWQAQADAVPPDDTWTWNADAARWQGGDVGADAVADSVSDGEVAAPDVAGDGGDGGLTDGPKEAGGTKDTAGLPDPGPGQPGAPCASHKACKSGFCAGIGSGQAYCATAGCGTSDDCNFKSDVPVCCVTYAKQSYCLKQWDATACGVQDKKPGESCAEGNQSDCETGSWCLSQGKQAVCIATCSAKDTTCPAGTQCVTGTGGGGCLPFTKGVVDGTGCAGKNIGGCGEGSYCIENWPGDPLAYCATVCAVDGDCQGAGYTCTKWGGAKGVCQKFGTKKAGDNCSGDRFSCSKGLLCIGDPGPDAVCSPQCTVDANCDGLASAVGGAYCAKGPKAAIGVCYPQGSKGNGEACGKDPYACSKGAYCIGGYDNYNPDAFCQVACGANSSGTCPAGAKCVSFTPNYSGCQVEGTKGHGESCAGAATSCKLGHLCAGAQGKELCMKQCEVGAAAGSEKACTASGGPTASAWCSPWGGGKNGVCIPSGSAKTGTPCVAAPWSCAPGSFCQQWGQVKDATCIATCGASGTCPTGTDCKDFGQAGKYCQPSGGKPQGASCVDDANSCAPGHVCISKGSPHAICSKQCSADSQCGAGPGGTTLWCGIGKWGGYCLTDGDIAKNGLCFGKPWNCDKGLICLGNAAENPGAFCSIECSGFASVCGVGEKCEYFGGGQSWCVKTGKLPHGSVCLDQPLDCDPTTLCIKGSPQSQCLQTCGVGKPACPADSPCTWFPGSALKLCVPKGFTPFGPLSVPF